MLFSATRLPTASLIIIHVSAPHADPWGTVGAELANPGRQGIAPLGTGETFHPENVLVSTFSTDKRWVGVLFSQTSTAPFRLPRSANMSPRFNAAQSTV